MHAALQVARKLGPGKTVVTVLPDSGTRYITKFLSDAWMRDHGFTEKGPELGLVEDLLKTRQREIITARSDEPISAVVEKLRKFGVSQIPIVDGSGKPVSIVHEVDLLRGLHHNTATAASPVSGIAQPIGGLIYPKGRLEELFKIFETDQVAVVVDAGKILGIISQIDLIEYMARRGK